jgi:hypothetical protein
MRTLFLLLAFLFAVPRVLAEPGDKLPSFDIDRNCSAEASGVDIKQARAGCVRDEADAKKQLQQEWSKLGSNLKRQCVGESTIGGDQSYVELLTCLQMSSEWTGERTARQAPSNAQRH